MTERSRNVLRRFFAVPLLAGCSLVRDFDALTANANGSTDGGAFDAGGKAVKQEPCTATWECKLDWQTVAVDTGHPMIRELTSGGTRGGPPSRRRTCLFRSR